MAPMDSTLDIIGCPEVLETLFILSLLTTYRCLLGLEDHSAIKCEPQNI